MPNRLPEQAQLSSLAPTGGYNENRPRILQIRNPSVLLGRYTRNHLGGPGEIRTRVLNTSSLKELQLYAYYSALYLACQVIVLSKAGQNLIVVCDGDHYGTCPASNYSRHTRTVRFRDVRQLSLYGSV